MKRAKDPALQQTHPLSLEKDNVGYKKKKISDVCSIQTNLVNISWYTTSLNFISTSDLAFLTLRASF